MRVLLATDHFPPFIGGAHRWAALLVNGLARRGHDVAVATMWYGGAPRVEQYGDHDIPVHRIRQLRTAVPALVRDERQRHAPPFPDPVSVHDLRKVINAARPDVVLSHGWIAFSAAGALLRSDVPLVASIHDYGLFCTTRTLLYEGAMCSGPAPAKCLRCAADYYGRPKGWTAVAGVRLSRSVIARRIDGLQSVASFVDEVMTRYLLGRTADRNRVRRFTIPAFLDSDDDDADTAVQAVLEKLPDEPFILFVGAFRRGKGIDVLRDAYERLENPPPLVMMGTVERDAPQHLPSGALVLTDVPHAAVMASWDRAMLGVVPSILPEPLGTVSIEGISRGVPVIATAPSGMSDVLGDGAGILVPHGDAGALAEAMQSLIADPKLREALSRKGRERSETFQAEAVLTRYEEMFERMVADR
jgi:glycosyltransferase involved in cell wall biosynthesis